MEPIGYLVFAGVLGAGALAVWLALPKGREVHGIRIQGKKLEDEETVVKAARRVLARRWPDRFESFLDGVEVKVMPKVQSARLPDGKLPDGRHVAGTLDPSEPQPGRIIQRIVLAYVKPDGSEFKSFWETAFVHELVLHHVSIKLGLGDNRDHSNAELMTVFNEITEMRSV